MSATLMVGALIVSAEKKPAGQVRMNAAGGLDSRAALADEPGPDFFLAGREEDHLPGSVHDATDDVVLVHRLHLHFAAEFIALFSAHCGEVDLQCDRKCK